MIKLKANKTSIKWSRTKTNQKKKKTEVEISSIKRTKCTFWVRK